jgi:hypothetical protein
MVETLKPKGTEPGGTFYVCVLVPDKVLGQQQAPKLAHFLRRNVENLYGSC